MNAALRGQDAGRGRQVGYFGRDLSLPAGTPGVGDTLVPARFVRYAQLTIRVARWLAGCPCLWQRLSR